MSSPDKPDLFHRAFAKLSPAIRFFHETIMGRIWFSRITAKLWLGGAPIYRRDYAYIMQQDITAVVNVRNEGKDETDFYDRHGITHVQYSVPDVTVPDERIITEAVDWMKEQVGDGRTVLVHCAKGRGRSATILAAYLMREEALTFADANALMKSKRPLTKLESKHRRVLETWLAGENES